MTKKNTRRELTPYEKDCASRLKEIFLHKKDEGLTQSKLAEKTGMTQSAIGQYLNGKIPLNLEALILFSLHLDCKIQDIDPKNPIFLSIHEEERALISAYWEMKNSGNLAGKQALLQVAALSPAFGLKLPHNE